MNNVRSEYRQLQQQLPRQLQQQRQQKDKEAGQEMHQHQNYARSMMPSNMKEYDKPKNNTKTKRHCLLMGVIAATVAMAATINGVLARGGRHPSHDKASSIVASRAHHHTMLPEKTRPRYHFRHHLHPTTRIRTTMPVHARKEVLTTTVTRANLIPSSPRPQPLSPLSSSFFKSPLSPLSSSLQSYESSFIPSSFRSVSSSLRRTASMVEEIKGYESFVRHNPMSDKFGVLGFDHVEFWCGDALAVSNTWKQALGMRRIARSDLSTGNDKFCSIVIGTHNDKDKNNIKMAFTSPYPTNIQGNKENEGDSGLMPFDSSLANDFIMKHGTAVRAVGLRVEDVNLAYEVATRDGKAKGITPPTLLTTKTSNNDGGQLLMCELGLYGDVVLRLISDIKQEENENDHDHDQQRTFTGHFLPNFKDDEDHDSGSIGSDLEDFGISSIDHVVGNVPDIKSIANYIIQFTGFHEFAEFTTEDVGTVESGLNSLVLANNLENVLLPINEPVTENMKRQSQIETYLIHNQGPGVQHIALKTNDIFTTIEKMRSRLSSTGSGFELMRRPSPSYYEELPTRLGDKLTNDQYEQIERLGLLADADDQGILIQIFTTPVTYRPTLFLEIIQRIGCEVDGPSGETEQKGGCGGFGKGNFRELFKSIEDYEKEFVK